MSASGESADEWITQYRELLDENHIDCAFRPYKKMDSSQSIVSFPRPAYWDEIVACAKLPGTMGATENASPSALGRSTSTQRLPSCSTTFSSVSAP